MTTKIMPPTTPDEISSMWSEIKKEDNINSTFNLIIMDSFQVFFINSS